LVWHDIIEIDCRGYLFCVNGDQFDPRDSAKLA
jgi:hypothetical protein